MKSLLLVAHGSRNEAANTAIQDLTEMLRQSVESGTVDRIEHCFLELAKPSIPDAIQSLVKSGVSEIVLLPYFLSPGAHVTRDVPELVEAARRQYPQISMTVLPHLGEAPGLVLLIQQQVQAFIREV